MTERLTPRELEVLRLMTKGLRNSEIARILCMSEATVRNGHVRNIMHKLEARSRTEAVIKAVSCGLIVPEQEPESAAAILQRVERDLARVREMVCTDATTK